MNDFLAKKWKWFRSITWKDFYEYSKDTLKNGGNEICSAAYFLLKQLFKLVAFIIKPSKYYKCDFRGAPFRTTFGYFLDILMRLFRFLMGKPIENHDDASVKLYDFWLFRFIIAGYLAFIAIYFYTEIGWPKFTSISEEFEQLFKYHPALVNITVAFATSITIISLVHNSMVSDIQLKEILQTNKISNYFSILKHITEHAKSIIISNAKFLKEDYGFPATLAVNLFKDSKNSDYSLNPEFLNILNRLDTICPSETALPYLKIFPRIDDAINSLANNIEAASFFYTIYGDTFNTESNHNKFLNSFSEVKSLDMIYFNLLEILSLYEEEQELEDIKSNHEISHVESTRNYLRRTLHLIRSINGLIATIPLSKITTLEISNRIKETEARLLSLIRVLQRLVRTRIAIIRNANEDSRNEFKYLIFFLEILLETDTTFDSGILIDLRNRILSSNEIESDIKIDFANYFLRVSNEKPNFI